MSDKLIGKTLAGRFVLEEALGTGATGHVYRAQQTSVDRVVAVKTLHAFLQEREDFKARFEIEAKAIARLNHPNCITLYDFGYDEAFDVFYMAVEYIKGEQLADLMVDDMLMDDVLSISYQVADALEHAHREGILHRDLKPENIMITAMPDTGRLAVKVLDFGLARLYESAAEESNEPPSGRYKQITQAGQVYGTPAYMSPEQCRANKELTPATDIYALGTMMFELLEGRLPFFSKSTAELIMMQMTEDPPRMDRIDVPEELRDLIYSMMVKDPAARPQTARDVLMELLPYVRLDASQEFRILPNASGELAQLTAEQVESLSKDRFDSQDRLRPMTETLGLPDEEIELSNDELRSAKGSRFGLITGVALLVAAIFLALVVSSDSGSSGAAVDSAAAAVADSPVVVPKASEAQEPVEVAKNTDNGEKGEKTRKRRKSKKSAKPAGKSAAPAADKPPRRDTGLAPAPAEHEADRPKTLKLTY